jgi:hypothetical protein
MDLTGRGPTLSTAEAEYMAAASAVKGILWLHQLLSEVGYDLTAVTTLKGENQSATKLHRNPVSQQEPNTLMRYITLAPESVMRKKVVFQYVHSH